MTAIEKPMIDETILKMRYIKISKILAIISLLYIIWIAFIIAGVYFFELGYRALIFSPEDWIYSCIILISLFILFEIIFVFHFVMVKKRKVEAEKPKPEYFKSKRIYIFTYPHDSKGGAFSKTYIHIDENNILNLRTLMISAGELWQKKQERQ